MLAGLVKNPTGYDPTNYPDRALERRNVVLDRMAQLQRDRRGQGREAQGAGPRPRRRQHPQRLRVLPGAVLLRLRRSTGSTHDQSLGKTVAERKQLIYSGGLTIHTTIDLRDQDAADNVGRRRTSTRPTRRSAAWRWSSRGTGDVKALAQSRPMGREQEGRDLPQLRRARRSTATPTASRPARRSRRSCSPPRSSKGIPLNTTINAPQQVHIPMSNYRDLRRPQLLQHRRLGARRTPPAPGTFDLYTGTQQSVNTFFAQLEEQTGLCEPYRLAKAMGIDLDRPATASGSRRSPSASPSTSPLEMAEAYATFAARGLHCDARPVTSIEDSDGNMLKDYPEQCQQVMPGGRPPTPSTTSCAASGARRLRLRRGHLARPALGRQDRHHQRQHGGVVRRLHAQPGHRRR